MIFQSTPSARRATAVAETAVGVRTISIHALREEGDVPPRPAAREARDFNPRPPRGGRPSPKRYGRASQIFQSTPSARRATKTGAGRQTDAHYFNPRPPRGGRRCGSCSRCMDMGNFNPRPPRGGRRHITSWHDLVSSNFNPRPPRGGRQRHTLFHPVVKYFNPRPPRGGRRPAGHMVWAFGLFQSTPSARRATSTQYMVLEDTLISIHALREEGDSAVSGWATRLLLNFNPRPPRGGRPPHHGTDRIHGTPFQSTPSARRATVKPPVCSTAAFYFNPRPPRGGRQQKRRKNPPRLFHYTHLCTI